LIEGNQLPHASFSARQQRWRRVFGVARCRHESRWKKSIGATYVDCDDCDDFVDFVDFSACAPQVPVYHVPLKSRDDRSAELKRIESVR
jgi:hypothetical protein